MDNPSSKHRPIFRLRDLLKPSFDLWLFSWLLGIIFAVSIIALLMISGWFLTGAALAGMVALGSHTFNYMLPAGIIRMLAMARTASRYGELMVSHNAVFDVLKTLRLRFFSALAVLPLSQQRHTLNASQYMHRLVSDIDQLNEFVLRVVSPWIVSCFTLVALALFIGWVLPLTSLSLLIVTICLALVLIVPFIATRQGIHHASHIAEIQESRRSDLLAPLSMITQLLLWQQWTNQTNAYVEDDKTLHRLQWKAQLKRSIYMLVVQYLCYLCIVVILFTLLKLDMGLGIGTDASSASEPSINVPLVMAVTLGLLGIQEIVVPLAQHFMSLGNTLAAKNRLNELLNRPSQQPSNLSKPDPTLTGTTQLPLPAHPLHATLKHVYAKIPSALIGAQDVNAIIDSGIPLIIKGPSGCGKSTLLQMLANELPLLKGSVTLNGHDWFGYDWQDQLGYLGQQLDIFDQSLAANLRLGKPDATDKELGIALEKVGLLDWLHSQPLGLDTLLGEYGTAISGGQARRIALARLLLKPRRVLLLDEPFAGLDENTREHVWQSVRTHQQQGILIIVSHHEWDMGTCQTLTLEAGVFDTFD